MFLYIYSSYYLSSTLFFDEIIYLLKKKKEETQKDEMYDHSVKKFVLCSNGLFIELMQLAANAN